MTSTLLLPRDAERRRAPVLVPCLRRVASRLLTRRALVPSTAAADWKLPPAFAAVTDSPSATPSTVRGYPVAQRRSTGEYRPVDKYGPAECAKA